MAPRTNRRTRPIAAAALAGLLATTACGSDGSQHQVALGLTAPDGGEAAPEPEPEPEPAPEPEPEPAPEEPETEEPETEEPETEEPVDDSDDGMIALLGLALLLLAIGVVIALIRSGRKTSPTPTASTAPRPSALGELLSGARWVHDVGTMEVLRATDRTTLSQAWSTVSAQMIELETRSGSLVGVTSRPETQQALQQLTTALASLRGALGQDVAVRSDPAQSARADLVQASAQTVQQRRLELDAAIANPWLRAG